MLSQKPCYRQWCNFLVKHHVEFNVLINKTSEYDKRHSDIHDQDKHYNYCLSVLACLSLPINITKIICVCSQYKCMQIMNVVK